MTARSPFLDGAVNTTRLEQALRSAGFEPDSKRLWRWQADDPEDHALIKFELLADRSDRPAGAEIRFRDCESLGAANLRGTGFASRDIDLRRIGANIGGIDHQVEVNWRLGRCRLGRLALRSTGRSIEGLRCSDTWPAHEGSVMSPDPAEWKANERRFVDKGSAMNEGRLSGSDP